jgi:hypothetical protein
VTLRHTGLKRISAKGLRAGNGKIAAWWEFADEGNSDWLALVRVNVETGAREFFLLSREKPIALSKPTAQGHYRLWRSNPDLQAYRDNFSLKEHITNGRCLIVYDLSKLRIHRYPACLWSSRRWYTRGWMRCGGAGEGSRKSGGRRKQPKSGKAIRFDSVLLRQADRMTRRPERYSPWDKTPSDLASDLE